MITLIHGNNIDASRNEMNRLRAGFTGKEIRVLDGKYLTETDLTQALESASLFGFNLVVIIERIFSALGRKTKTADSYFKIFQAQSSLPIEIIIWEDKELTKIQTGKLGKNVLVKLFKYPQLIFNFLDSFRPHNTKFLIETYQIICKTEAPELVFSMLSKRLRQLIIVKDNLIPTGLQAWQADRLTSQAKYFSMEQLTGLYQKLIEIEYSIKSGQSVFNFEKSLELFIINLA